MTTEVLSSAFQTDRLRQALAAPLWMWCALVLAVHLGFQLIPTPPPLDQMLGDTDDATRLIGVREFLAGAPWFDTTLPRYGAPDALVSHWSRLVDLPLALLIGALSMVLPETQAEIAIRALWPSMLLGLMLFAVARAAEERGGRSAAFIALALTILNFSATVQFGLGRIDHHNLQNLAAVTGILLLASAFQTPRHGTWAGVVLGLGMAVGYEALLVTGGSLAIAAVMSGVYGRGQDGVARAAKAFAVTLLVAFLATAAPSRWFTIHCDALSLNFVVLASLAAAGLAVATAWGQSRTLVLRFVALAGAGATAVAAYGLMDPACLAGPFGQVDPAIYPIWLDKVSETKSFLWLYDSLPPSAVVVAAHILLGVTASTVILRTDRDDTALFYTLVLLVTAALSFWQVKLLPYASLLAIAPLALLIARIPSSPEVSAPTLRAAAVALLNQKTLLVAAALILGFDASAAEKMKAKADAKKACISVAGIAPLAGLPPGLTVADVDAGPYIVAGTRLSVLSAPYHRIDRSIIAADHILNGPAVEAEGRLRALGAAYVVTCPGWVEDAPSGGDTLQGALLAGRTPGYLDPVPLQGDGPVKVWRLKPL
ncbi:MAG: hypothetical protein ACT4N2_01770 [Hyphomicrobium sp.]